MAKRDLRLYELICSPSNINLMVHIECKILCANAVKEAFRMVKKRHPYFRMKIETNSETKSLQFVEMTTQSEIESIYLEKFDLNSKTELNEWQSRLINFGSKFRDSSRSVFFLELYSFENDHQLYINVNHSGIDGPGLFQAIRDFCAYLDLILGQKSNLNIESREFLDIHGSYDHSYDLEDLKKDPIIDDYMEPVQVLNGQNQDQNQSKPFLNSKFFQLDEQETQNLISNCRKNNSTVQAALSTAMMFCLINSKEKLNEEITFVNSCPCNMRSLLNNVSSQDIVCGSSALIWPQKVNIANSFVWPLAKENSEKIKSLLSENYGLKWWLKLKNSIKFQGFSVMSSSMGVISMDESKLNNFKIKDIRFLGSAHNITPGTAAIMSHAFTFMQKFTFNFSYTYPALDDRWAQIFFNNLILILRHLANQQSLDTKLKDLFNSLEKY